MMLQAAIPVALQKGKPGTAEFRAALRDALEQVKELVLCARHRHHLARTTTTASTQRARVMVTIEDGTWKLLP